MRKARNLVSNRPCYYLIVNRLKPEFASVPAEIRQQGLEILDDLLSYYLVDVLSVSWFEDGFAMLVHTSNKAPAMALAAERHNAYPGNERKQVGPRKDKDECKTIAERMVSLEVFVRVYQQRMSVILNRYFHNKGSIWRDRYSSIEITASELLPYMAFVELDAVRGREVTSPFDYQFCSAGIMAATGKHPFADALVSHLGDGKTSGKKVLETVKAGLEIACGYENICGKNPKLM